MKKLLLLLLCFPIFGFGQKNKTPNIGDTFQGGIVFYLDGDGGGLIVAPDRQSSSDGYGSIYEWGCYGNYISGANGTAIGTGKQNTIDIINNPCFPSKATNKLAASLCNDLTYNGYSDWFLPSKDELNQLYVNSEVLDNWGFYLEDQKRWHPVSQNYWTSSQIDNKFAWTCDLPSYGPEKNFDKKSERQVRCIRYFEIKIK
jgi:hypothetical protein